jgi:hypothetical protein
MFINSNLEEFKNDVKIGLEFLNKWFKANRLSPNFGKNSFIKFSSISSPHIDLDLSYANKLISKGFDKNFMEYM